MFPSMPSMALRHALKLSFARRCCCLTAPADLLRLLLELATSWTITRPALSVQAYAYPLTRYGAWFVLSKKISLNKLAAALP